MVASPKASRHRIGPVAVNGHRGGLFSALGVGRWTLGAGRCSEMPKRRKNASRLRWARISFPVLVALLTASCGPRFTNANIDVVNREFDTVDRLGKGGVSGKEVEAILGPPKRVESYKLELQTQKKELDGVRYYYEQDGQTLELHFLDDKLISKVPALKLPATPVAKIP